MPDYTYIPLHNTIQSTATWPRDYPIAVNGKNVTAAELWKIAGKRDDEPLHVYMVINLASPAPAKKAGKDGY